VIAFTDFLLTENFKSDVDEVLKILNATKGTSAMGSKLDSKLKSWAKKRGTPIKLEILVDDTYEHIDVAGAYYSELDEVDKVPVSITIQLPKFDTSTLDLELAIKFVTAVDHEYQHAKQSRSRDFIPPRSVSRKHISDKAKYLANTDEIDSYSKEVTNEMILGKLKAIDFNTILRVSPTLKMYVNLFGKHSKEVKALLKKAIKYHEDELNS
jgi:hypothetical protein